MCKAYSKFLDLLEKLEKAFLAITVGVMVIVIMYQVILRYVFNSANAWSEELARYLFIYDVMVASAIAIRRNSHLQIDVLISKLGPKTKAIFTIVSTIAGMVFMGILMSYSLDLCATAVKTKSSGVPITMNYAYASIPIGIVLMLLASVEVILKAVEDLKGGAKA